MNVKTVAVIGVTGTMGANVAGIFASFGAAKVYCVGRNIDKIKATIPKIIRSVKSDCIEERLVPCTLDDLDKCVADSDLIFESLTEDYKIKTDIYSVVNDHLKSSTVVCTGTSGLSITKLASAFSEENRKRFFGVHLFNPPYSMPLCELISTKYSDLETKKELQNYLQIQLLRTVVEASDSPAFLANRIGFQFINEALLYSEKYKDNGGIDYIDAIIGPYTGRAMPPLITSDFVGLDVHKAIVDNLYENTNDYVHDSFVFPSFAKELVANGCLGRKSGKGLYQTILLDNGLKRQMVYDLNTKTYRDRINYVFPFAIKMKEKLSMGEYEEAIKALVNNRSLEADICLLFLLKYITYSLFTAEQVSNSINSADDVMATGFNWCPPIALFYAINNVDKVKDLIGRFNKGEFPENVNELIDQVLDSRYDYRRYFKA